MRAFEEPKGDDWNVVIDLGNGSYIVLREVDARVLIAELHRVLRDVGSKRADGGAV